MKIHVIFGRRKDDGHLQYGIEALACMSDDEYSDYPDHFLKQMHSLEKCGDFENLAIVELEVDKGIIEQAFNNIDKNLAQSLIA